MVRQPDQHEAHSLPSRLCLALKLAQVLAADQDLGSSWAALVARLSVSV